MPSTPEIAHALTQPAGQGSRKIGGSDYQVIECHEIDGCRAQRLGWSPGYEQWRCECDELLAIKAPWMKPWRKHCEWARRGTRHLGAGFEPFRTFPATATQHDKCQTCAYKHLVNNSR